MISHSDVFLLCFVLVPTQGVSKKLTKHLSSPVPAFFAPPGTPVTGRLDRKDCYVGMLAPGGHLCVFGTGGEVYCMSRGVNRWEMHTYEG